MKFSTIEGALENFYNVKPKIQCAHPSKVILRKTILNLWVKSSWHTALTCVFLFFFALMYSTECWFPDSGSGGNLLQSWLQPCRLWEEFEHQHCITEVRVQRVRPPDASVLPPRNESTLSQISRGEGVGVCFLHTCSVVLHSGSRAVLWF